MARDSAHERFLNTAASLMEKWEKEAEQILPSVIIKLECQ